MSSQDPAKVNCPSFLQFEQANSDKRIKCETNCDIKWFHNDKRIKCETICDIEWFHNYMEHNYISDRN